MGKVYTTPTTAPLSFADLASTSARVAGTRSRLEKRQFLVDLLSRTPPEEVAPAVGWLIEEPRCGPLGVGPAQLWALSRSRAPDAPSLSLDEIERTLAASNRGGREETLRRVAALMDRLTQRERDLFVGALTGSLRQGSLGGVMVLALAALSGRDEGEVRRTVMVTGSIANAAEALLGAGAQPTPPTALVLFRPIAPMLAAPADSLAQALARAGEPLVEWKIDGVRAQVHKRGGRVEIYSRQGNAITGGCGPLLAPLAALAAEQLVLDGEVALVAPDGVARPFQDSFSVVASKAAPSGGDRLRIYLFDCMHRDGVDLLDEPLSRRLETLREVAPADLRMPSARVHDPDEAERFYAGARAAGHEGVMVKDLASPYRLGARGRAWQKVKEFSSVDLVVLAAEWGSGRRRGLLSNLHLGARREDGTFCMVGKTFKGLTDEMLRWQTARLEQLATERAGHVVYVRPELVVEVRFNDVQRSPRYPGGIALRFARVVRFREDKPAAEAEPLDALVAKLPASEGDKPGEHGERPARRRDARGRKKRQLSLFDD